MRLTWKRTLLALLLAIVAIGAWKGTQWLAFARGVQAYLYGYPLITSDITRRVLTAPGIAPRLGSGPVNKFSHVREFPDDKFRDVVAPNADTLYSIAWLDLASEPLVLHQPDMGRRYVLFGLLDAWSNSQSLGTRMYGHGPVDYAIVGPGWTGTLPVNMKRIDVATPIAWIIVRTGTSGKADYDAVHAIQDQYTLTPLSQVASRVQSQGPAQVPQQSPVPQDEPPAPTEARLDLKTPIVTQVAQLDARQYFGRLASLMAQNPPAALDAKMVATLGRIGITPGQAFDAKGLSDAQQRGLDDAVWFVRALFEARARGTQGDLQQGAFGRWFFDTLTTVMNKALLNERNGWLIPMNLGQYENRYPLRAIVTLVGFGANGPQDAVYPKTSVDADGRALDGAQRYMLHFDRAQIPPASAFWSLTMYDEASFFIDNPISRYAIGDRDPLKFNADGSLDLVIQRDAPADTSNWLPAPAGKFALMLRLYDPKPDVLDGRWVPPAVARK